MSLRLSSLAILCAAAFAGAAHGASSAEAADPAPMFDAPPPSSRFT